MSGRLGTLLCVIMMGMCYGQEQGDNPQRDWAAIAELTPDHVGKDVKIQGRVRERLVLPEGVKLVVEDETGKIEVMLLKEIFHLHEHFYRIKAEYTVKAAGKLVVVGGVKQVQPTAALEIVSLPPLTPKPQPVAKREATITGEVLGSQVIPPGIRLVLTKVRGMPDDCQVKPWHRLDVILPKPSLEEVGYVRDIAQDSIVKVRGTIEKYRDRYQLQISSSSAIFIITRTSEKPRADNPDSAGPDEEMPEFEEEPVVPVSTRRQIGVQELHAPLMVSGTLVRGEDDWELEVDGERFPLIFGPGVAKNTLREGLVRIYGSLTRDTALKLYVLAVEMKND